MNNTLRGLLIVLILSTISIGGYSYLQSETKEKEPVTEGSIEGKILLGGTLFWDSSSEQICMLVSSDTPPIPKIDPENQPLIVCLRGGVDARTNEDLTETIAFNKTIPENEHTATIVVDNYERGNETYDTAEYVGSPELGEDPLRIKEIMEGVQNL
jgi:hypothetical protein